MADIKFSCPTCSQHISCDEGYAGVEIQCPACQGKLTVPAKSAPMRAHVPVPPPPPATPPPVPPSGGSLVPKPPPQPAPRLSTQKPAQEPAKAGEAADRVIPIRNLAPTVEKKTSLAATIAKVAALLIVLGVGGYYGFTFLIKKQNEMNAQARREEGGEGQVAHIQGLNNFLDATEPGGAGLGSLAASEAGAGAGSRPPGLPPDTDTPAGDPGTSTNVAPELKLPVIAPTHNLDLQFAKIPESRVNGKISGTNFVAEAARLDRTATSHVLRFYEGALASPDREILIYLKLKAGEKPGGQTVEIATDARGATVPSVVKRWKPNPRYAAQMKTYSTGYVMKLELGAAGETGIPGKVYLALPDPEKTVIAGRFRLDTATAADPMQAMPMVSPEVPAAGGRSAAETEQFRRRYGLPPGPR